MLGRSGQPAVAPVAAREFLAADRLVHLTLPPTLSTPAGRASQPR